MNRKMMLAMVAFGVFGVSVMSDGMLNSTAQGAQWRPFYGYHQPNYLNGSTTQASTVCVEPAAPQASTVSGPAAQPTAAVERAGNARCSTARWYPFYGYHRPGYLDQ
jgi:hypothetical protein